MATYQDQLLGILDCQKVKRKLNLKRIAYPTRSWYQQLESMVFPTCERTAKERKDAYLEMVFSVEAQHPILSAADT